MARASSNGSREEGRRVYGDMIPGHLPDKRILVLSQPIGVAASITPWNFPNAMIARKVAPALAAGCAFVARPSELTPLSALAMAALAERAGVPAGVLNVVTSAEPRGVGQEFCANPKVRKLSFTGSTRVGSILMRQSAEGIKKLSLELGGNAPFIVFDDADLDKAVEGALIAKYPQRRPDLRLRQPDLCPARRPRRLRRQARRRRRQAQGRRRRGARRADRPDDQPGRAGQGRSACRRRARARRRRSMTGGRRHPAGPLFYDADRADRRQRER